MGSRARIKVFVGAEYTYSKSMLHQELYLQDAIDKAKSDFINDATEMITRNEGIDPNFIYAEVIEELPFKLRKNVVNEKKSRDNRKKIDYDIIWPKLVSGHMERIYGKVFDPEVSPDLFEYTPPKFGTSGELEQEETWCMKPEVETEWNKAHDHYMSILRKIML